MNFAKSVHWFGRPSPPHYNREKGSVSCFLTNRQAEKAKAAQVEGRSEEAAKLSQRNLEAIDALIAAGAALSALKRTGQKRLGPAVKLARQASHPS